MFTLYMDNFRGFADTHLPLKGMNFFVGENSTGKSSALSLIHMLNQEKFWEKNQLYFEDYYYFGAYPDITDNENIVKFGVYNNKFEKVSNIDRSFNTAIFSFENNLLNTPQVCSVHFLIDNYTEMLEILMDISQERFFTNLYYKYHKGNNIPNSKDVIFDTKNLDDDYNLKKLASPIFPLGYIIDNFYLTGTYDKSDTFPSYEIYWFAPIRTKPQRTYDQYIDNFTADGKHIPYLLRNLVNNPNEKNKSILEAINHFGKRSGLFQEIIVKQYGESINAPFEIQFQMADGTYRISNVGYGVSQVLPLIVQVLVDDGNGWFMIQQPEVHLHPKAQSALGEFFFSAFEQGKKLFVETHSDFIIDGFRRKLSESPKAVELAEQAQVVFFEKEGDGNRLNCIELEEDGEYKLSEATERFRSFFVQEALQNIGL